MIDKLSENEERFANRAMGRSQVFLRVMWIGLAVALFLAIHTLYLTLTQTDTSLSLRWVVIILILLNARLNLRQHRYAETLRKLMPSREETRT